MFDLSAAASILLTLTICTVNDLRAPFAYQITSSVIVVHILLTGYKAFNTPVKSTKRWHFKFLKRRHLHSSGLHPIVVIVLGLLHP